MPIIVLLLLILTQVGLVAGDVAATEAAVNANPKDYRAWTNHAAALIQSATAQTGEAQIATAKMALQCALKGQELCIQNTNDTSIILNRGDDFCLGILGLAQMANGMNREAVDSFNKALAALAVKKQPTLADMQAKTNIEATRDRLITQMAGEKATKQEQKAQANAMPVVGWREAALSSTKVARIVNLPTAPVVLMITHARGKAPLKVARLELAPAEIREIGHMEGFGFKTGDELTLLRVDSGANATVVVP